jgi:hypothetical protein
MVQEIKTSSFGRVNKRLKISDGKLVFISHQIDLQSVTHFKYGVEPIQVDMFYVGRKLVIELKSDEHVKIVFKSYFGFSWKDFSILYGNILSEVWQDTAIRIFDESIESLRRGETVTVGKCALSREGISFDNFKINLRDLSYQKNYNKLTLNSKSNAKIFTNLYYLEDYNVDVLMAVLDWIYKSDGLQELEKDVSV